MELGIEAWPCGGMEPGRDPGERQGCFLISTEMLPVTVFPRLAQHGIGDGGHPRLTRAEHPYALFFGQRRGGANRTQGDIITGAFKFQRVARPEVQFIPEGLGEHHPTSAVYGQSRIHNCHFTLGGPICKWH